MKEDTTMDFISGLVDKLGFKLVKKEREAIKTFVPENASKYESMSSKMLLTELKMLEQDKLKFEALHDRMRKATINFMNKQQGNEVTKRLFEGQNFISSKLRIDDKSYIELLSLYDFVSSMFRSSIEKEMKERFVTINPDLAGQIESMTVEQTPTGSSLVIKATTEIQNKTTLEEVN